MPAPKIFWILIALFSLSLKAQQKFEFVQLRNNYFYRGAPNPVKIFSNGKYLNPQGLNIEITGGTFRKTDTCIWIETTSRIVNLKIFDKKGIPVFTKDFKALSSALPTITLDGAGMGGTVEKAYLLCSKGFVGNHFSSGDVFMPSEKIESYKATISIGNETRGFSFEGPLLSDSLKMFMAKMKPYDKIEFTDFSLSDFRKVFTPSTFEIYDNADVISNLKNVLFEYKNHAAYIEEPFAEHEMDKPYEVPGFSYYYYDTFPRIVETNCNSLTDTCSMRIFYIINNKKTLTYTYSFYGSDSTIKRYYYEDKMLGTFSYKDGAPCGPFQVFYPNGEKRLEGLYTASNKLRVDTIMRINPLTLNEEQGVIHYWHFPFRNGCWKYYDHGVPLKTVWYKDDEITERKNYYTGDSK